MKLIRSTHTRTHTYNVYRSACRSFIHNSLEQKTTQMSINKRIDKQIVAYSYNGILYTHEEHTTYIHNDTY